jgi:hypothetical protein
VQDYEPCAAMHFVVCCFVCSQVVNPQPLASQGEIRSSPIFQVCRSVVAELMHVSCSHATHCEI